MPSLRDQVDEINEALKERTGWEQELARGEAQRKCLDRAKSNNNPWPKASNVRYPLSDTMIAQFTPFLFKIYYASERCVTFRPTSSKNADFGGVCADWMDLKIKTQTELEEEIQPCIDKMLQDGETVMKVMWNNGKQTWEFEHVDNLFFITPNTALCPLDTYAPWCVHVLNLSPKKVRKKFKHCKNIDSFVESIKDGSTMKNDQGQREETEYQREGINISPKNKNIVLWEKHYKTADGKHRIVTLSPDDAGFDFEDDRGYQHEIGGYMFEHTRWEKLDRKPHSARGIPRLVMEGEFTMTAIERAKQNSMTLYNTPVWWPASGQLPSNMQNVQWQPGSGMPFPIEIAKFGEPPISWDIELRNQREKWERRVGSPDYGIGSANTQNDSRTATEVKAIAFQQSQSVDLITGNWRMFLGRIMKKAWAYVVEAKPESLKAFVDGKNIQIPQEALNNDWLITVTGSAESVNKESMAQKAIALWQMCANNPFANVGEAWKNVLQHLTPGEVDRFYQDPQERQQQQAKKTQTDIGTMVATGSPMLPDPTDDLLTAGMTAAQYLQREMQRASDPMMAQQMQGTPQLSAQTSQLISQYIAACREGLSRGNPQGYQQLNQLLNQIDIQSRQMPALPQQASPLAQGVPNDSTGGQGLPTNQITASNEQATPPANIIPMKETKEIRKSITIMRDASGVMTGARVVGVMVDEQGQVDPEVEVKNVNFMNNEQGQPVAATIEGVQQ